MNTVARAVCILLAIAIFVLLLLKKSRALWSTPKQLADEDDDDDDEDGMSSLQAPTNSQTPTITTEVQQPQQENGADEDGD